MRTLLCCIPLLLLSAVARADHPNVLYIISDDQAWTDYGFMGHDTIRTPYLDRLASQSAVFPRGYVPDSLCRPSLATLVTGLYPHQHLISGNDPVFKAEPGRPRYLSPDYLRLNARLIHHIEEVPTLPRLLGDEGYVSLQTGKWWEGNSARGGFTQGMTHGDPERGGRHGDAGLTIGRKGVQPIYDFIEAAGQKPWFVWYAPFLPHSPHNPPQRLLDKYSAPDKSIHMARYQAMCEWFDETCGELLSYLDEHDLAENTLVVYVADNGWIQDPASAHYAPKSKRTQYDGGLRTPIMLRWPGHIKPAMYKDTLVSSVDLAPTILHAAGIEPPREMPGLNLLDVCDNDGRTDRDAIFGAIYDHDIIDVDNPAASLRYRWVVKGDWKLIVPTDESKPVELYNLKNDPHETDNLAAANADRVKDLTATLDAWWSPT